MALKRKPVTGMKDILPREMEIRDYLIGLIKETYKTFTDSVPSRHHVWSISKILAASRVVIMRS